MTGKVARAALAAGIAAAVLSCSNSDDPIVRQDRRLTIASSTGSGRVTSSPAGIDCRIANGATDGTCSALFDDATTVSLSAVAGPDYLFKAWSGGGCSGAGACQVNLTSDVSVSVGFVPTVATLSLEYRTSSPDDGAAIIAISGPAIMNASPASGIQLARRTKDGKTLLLIRGNLTTGVVATVSVSGLDADKTFAATVEQVAARQSGNYAQRTNLGTYSASVR